MNIHQTENSDKLCQHYQRNYLGKIGCLSVKIAETNQEIIAAKKLRYKVFKSVDDSNTRFLDEDIYDDHCDHLIVIDENLKCCTDDPKVVATYRLLKQEVAKANNGFYSSTEFDVEELILRHPQLRFLELGRSCIHPAYRSKRTLELLWHGTWSYILHHGYDVVFGCASFTGTNTYEHSAGLSFLAHCSKDSREWQAAARGEVINIAELDGSKYELKNTLHALPPLIKGYLRVGAIFSPQAVIDREFGTIDVLVVMPIKLLNPRYVAHFGEKAERFSVT